MNIVWSTTPTEAEALKLCSEADFLREVNIALQGAPGFHAMSTNKPKLSLRAKAVIPCMPAVPMFPTNRATFPLSLGHAPEYVRNRIVLLGDAAHCIHPMAGQGVNLGIYDAEALSEVIQVAAAAGSDIGGDGDIHLLPYQKDRLPKNVAMMLAIHSLKSIYEVENESFNSLRGIGMNLWNLSPTIKSQTIRVAMGLDV
mmetsp:Transcript_16287/g.28503  ORF Transcript_16287/g.28503 Transcript_16287/m.28503 type:complete len:199 (+) Transcript_16287:3-599(+)